MALVLHVLPQMTMGGMERAVLEIATALERRGAASLVVSGGGPWVTRLQSLGIRHIEMPLNKAHAARACVRKLATLIETERPRIVHARSRNAIDTAACATAAVTMQARPKLVVTVHSYDDALLAANGLLRADRVIAVSRALSAHLRSHHPVLGSRLRTIARGVDLRHFHRDYHPSDQWSRDIEHRHPELANKTLVTMVARFSRWKGQHRLLALLDRLAQAEPTIHGLLVGPAPNRRNRVYRWRLVWQAHWRGVHNVTFMEPQDDIRNLYAISRIIVSLSSNPPETYGRTLMEALACGVPIIGYQHGGAAEAALKLFPEGAVTPNADHEVCDRILAFLRKPPDIPPVPSDFGVDTMTAAVLDLYRELGVDSK